MPSACGSSNQVPAAKPTFSRIRSEAALRWSGEEKYAVTSG